MLGYLSLDIVCSSKLTVFLELRSRKTVRFSQQIMSVDKYPRIFSRQMEAIAYTCIARDVMVSFDDPKWHIHLIFRSFARSSSRSLVQSLLG